MRRSVEEIKESLRSEGHTSGAVKSGLERLREEDQVREMGGKLFSRGAAFANRDSSSKRSVHDFEVEKVLPGKAIVKVDGKWRAVLVPEEFEGPRYLVKKGERFRGVADLYHEGGSFHAWVKGIVEN